MKRTLVAGALILAAAAAGAQSKPDFSGTWVLDVAQSEFGPLPPLEAMTHRIEHREPNLKIATTQKTAQGTLDNTRVLTTDGKENANRLKSFAGDQEARSTSQWKGTTLATSMKVEMSGMAVVVDDAWELTPDGKTLTIARRTTTPQGTIAQKFVFNKQ